jgi:hypothetical protein
MMQVNRWLIGAACAMGLLWAGVAGAQEKSDKPQAGEHSDAEKAMMEAYMKASQPGKEHAELAKMAGDWECVVKTFHRDQEGPPSKGTFRREMTMGGRYLHGIWKGDMGGHPFNGSDLMGYDNGRKVYWSVWCDDMSTGAMWSEGTADESGKVITMKGQAYDVMTQGMVTYKTVTTIVSENENRMVMYQCPEGAPEMKMMEIISKRVSKKEQ